MIAEVHGKLPSAGANATDRMEDLLTSYCFGTMMYLPPGLLLLPFLSTARDSRNRQFGVPAADEPVDARFVFWPRSRSLRRELDVLIALRWPRRCLVVGVEAKYLSGKSSQAGKETDDGESEAESYQPATVPGDQLADELCEMDGGNFAVPGDTNTAGKSQCCLLYVTAHMFPPLADLQESEKHLPPEHHGRIFWTNWHQLWSLTRLDLCLPAVDYYRSLLINDLKRLLEHRGLSPYVGLELLPALGSHPPPSLPWCDPWLDGLTTLRLPHGLPLTWEDRRYGR